jgi:hypothetical protein
MRQFNAYSEQIVLAPNETFEWVVNANQVTPPATSVTVSSDDWPLPDPSYEVIPGTPTQATANNTPNESGAFECSPPGANVSSHTIIIAAQNFVPVCTGVTADPGDYFIWQNGNAKPVLIISDPSNKDFWPLSGQGHVVGANGTTAVQIPEDADPYPDGYVLKVTMEGSLICPQAAQPKLIVGSGK